MNEQELFQDLMELKAWKKRQEDAAELNEYYDKFGAYVNNNPDIMMAFINEAHRLGLNPGQVPFEMAQKFGDQIRQETAALQDRINQVNKDLAGIAMQQEIMQKALENVAGGGMSQPMPTDLVAGAGGGAPMDAGMAGGGGLPPEGMIPGGAPMDAGMAGGGGGLPPEGMIPSGAPMDAGMAGGGGGLPQDMGLPPTAVPSDSRIKKITGLRYVGKKHAPRLVYPTVTLSDACFKTVKKEASAKATVPKAYKPSRTMLANLRG